MLLNIPLYILTGLLFVFSGIENHDFHVSKTEVHYKSEKLSLQISIHLFIDDLDLALAAYSDEALNILTEKEASATDSLFHLYLMKKLIFTADGKLLQPEFLGKEISDDIQGVWCYLECTKIEKPYVISLKNNLLCELYVDQKNIVSLKVDNKTKAFQILDNDDQELIVELE